jgi:hypothetical protein
MFITINKQGIKLYWVTTPDHDQDWFIFADSARDAQAYHENYEGYGEGDASSRLILSKVTLKEFMNGTPPCHARFEDLYQIGLQAGTIPGRRMRRFSGEIFRNGILEAIIELGRLKKTLEYGCMQVEALSSSTVTPGVETGPSPAN